MRLTLLCAVVLIAARPLDAQQPAGAVLPVANAVPNTYAGNCPARIEIVGRVTVTIPGTKIDYRWERSTGDTGKVLHAVIGNAAAPRDSLHPNVTETVPIDVWRVSMPTKSGRFWEALHILAPFDIVSNHAIVAVQCR